MFYIRIARLVPDLARINAVYTRRHGYSIHGLYVTESLEDALSRPHDAVIVASGREGYTGMMRSLAERGETILTETTFSLLSDSEIEEVEDIEGYTLEQYRNLPLFASVMEASKMIGDVSQLRLSALHNHHAATLIRAILGEEGMPGSVIAKDYDSRIARTGSRSGRVRSGEMESYVRKLRILEYPSGKLFIDDFSSNLYHSALIRPEIEVRGDRGIVNQEGVRYVNDEGYAISMPFVFHRDSEFYSGSSALSHVTLGSSVVFSNPFYPAPLSDDEIAIALCLSAFDQGHPEYTIRDGILDTRIGRLL